MDPTGNEFAHPGDIDSLDGCDQWKADRLVELDGPIGSTLSIVERIQLRMEIQRAYERCRRNCIGPSLVDHHYVLTHGRPHGNYAPWFNHRFPNTVAAMKNKASNIIAKSICRGDSTPVDDLIMEQIRPGHDDAERWPYDSIIVPDPDITNEAGYGDPLQSPYEANANLGTYTWMVTNVNVTQANGCCNTWTAKLIVVDDLGTGGDDPTFGSCFCRTVGFMPHTRATLAEYDISDSTCCDF